MDIPAMYLGRTPMLILSVCLGIGAANAEADLPLASIGEITYGTAAKPGAANCTGALIAPDLVLTAAHCLPEDTRITFAAGQDLDAARAIRTGHTEPFAHPARSTDPVGALANDLGLLRLDAPIPADQALPLPLTTTIKPSTRFTFIAYRRDAPHVASINTFCRLVQFNAPILGLTCPAISGNSGAPLLVLQDGLWQIAAVMVAQNRDPGPLRSFAVMPGPEIAAKITAP